MWDFSPLFEVCTLFSPSKCSEIIPVVMMLHKKYCSVSPFKVFCLLEPCPSTPQMVNLPPLLQSCFLAKTVLEKRREKTKPPQVTYLSNTVFSVTFKQLLLIRTTNQ